jgi:hypothetical protein
MYSASLVQDYFAFVPPPRKPILMCKPAIAASDKPELRDGCPLGKMPRRYLHGFSFFDVPVAESHHRTR